MSSLAHGAELVYRHSAVIRLTHWVAVLCVTLLFLSGLQIFNAHPALYLGQASRTAANPGYFKFAAGLCVGWVMVILIVRVLRRQ